MAPGSAMAPAPFAPSQLWRIDQALTSADRDTRLRFSVYIGELAEPTRQAAEQMHDQIDRRGTAVLLAVSPNQRVIEVVTGPSARRLITDRVCALAVLSMAAAFEGGDLTGGIITGVRMLADQASVG